MMPNETLEEWIALVQGNDFAQFDAEGLRLLTWFAEAIRPNVATFVHRVPMQDIWRLTPNRAVLESLHNRRVWELAHLKYPPAERANYGRANLPGRSVLYGSFSRISTQLETKPISGDLVTLTRWACDPSAQVAVSPIVFHPEVVSKMPSFEPHHARFRGWLQSLDPDLARYNKRVTEFMTGEFLKSVDRDNPVNYLVSATFADALLSDDRIEALIFPSVATQGLDVNVAIKPEAFDRLFRPVEAEELMIARVEPNGHYYQHRTARAHAFDLEKGRALWDAATSTPEDELPHLHEQLESGDGA